MRQINIAKLVPAFGLLWMQFHGVERRRKGQIEMIGSRQKNGSIYQGRQKIWFALNCLLIACQGGIDMTHVLEDRGGVVEQLRIIRG